MTALPEFALSIRQPWAWAIINAGKDIENRSWPTKFRGPVAIHAAKGMTRQELLDFEGVFRQAQRPSAPSYALDWKNPKLPDRADLPRGGIVGVAEIVECVNRSSSPWFFGPYGFVLRNARPVPFIPCRGALGFFRWERAD